jgi:hypothetical protein
MLEVLKVGGEGANQEPLIILSFKNKRKIKQKQFIITTYPVRNTQETPEE